MSEINTTQDYKLNLAPLHQYKLFQQLHLKEIIKNLLFITQCVLCGDIFRYFLIDPSHFSSLGDISLICQTDTYMSSLASFGADSGSGMCLPISLFVSDNILVVARHH